MKHFDIYKMVDAIENGIHDDYPEVTYVSIGNDEQHTITLKGFEIENLKDNPCIIISLSDAGVLYVVAVLGNADNNKTNLILLNDFNTHNNLFKATINREELLLVSAIALCDSIENIKNNVSYFLIGFKKLEESVELKEILKEDINN